MRKSRSSFNLYDSADSRLTYVHTMFGSNWPSLDIGDRRLILEDALAAAAFTGLHLLAFSIVGQGIHFLLEIPPKTELSREEMWRKLVALSNPKAVKIEEKLMAEGGDEPWERLERRFGDLGNFMKRVKQLAAERYHRKNRTRGSLWASRYGQTWVEKGYPAQILASWIDHAGVREESAPSVEKDRLCTFGSALGGSEVARTGLARLFSPENGPLPWRDVSNIYRQFLTEDAPSWSPAHLRPKTYGLPRQEMLLTPIPAFQEGLLLGSHRWVESVFERNRSFFSKGRKSGARRIAGLADPLLWTVRSKPSLVPQEKK